MRKGFLQSPLPPRELGGGVHWLLHPPSRVDSELGMMGQPVPCHIAENRS